MRTPVGQDGLQIWAWRCLAASLPLSLGLSFGPAALAVPVYLSPTSRFASGDIPRKRLEPLTQKIHDQLWQKIETRQGKIGWIRATHLLTPLHFVHEAKVLGPEAQIPLRAEAISDARTDSHVTAGQSVVVIEIRGYWVRVSAPGGREGWLPNDRLKPITEPRPSLGYLRATSHLRSSADVQATSTGKLGAGARVLILRLQEQGGRTWLEVSRGEKTGWILRERLYLSVDFSGKEMARILPRFTEALSAPQPESEIVDSLAYGEPVRILMSAFLSWGLAKTKTGELWWPMDGEDRSDPDSSPVFSTAELVERGIFSAKRSPVAPTLWFASSRGLFRTEGGDQWTQIPDLPAQNVPLAMSRDGVIFAGGYISYDHGESFEPWLRWDKVVEVLGTRPHGFRPRLTEIRVLGANENTLAIKIWMSRTESVWLMTNDLGESFHRVDSAGLESTAI